MTESSSVVAKQIYRNSGLFLVIVPTRAYFFLPLPSEELLCQDELRKVVPYDSVSLEPFCQLEHNCLGTTGWGV